jgi:hypothetical protein
MEITENIFVIEITNNIEFLSRRIINNIRYICSFSILFLADVDGRTSRSEGRRGKNISKFSCLGP